jgi:5,10-methylenetetrahydrofolate reductase
MAKKKGSLSFTKPVKFTLPSKVEESETMSIRLPNSLKQRLESFADDNDVKASALVKHILEQFLDAQGA